MNIEDITRHAKEALLHNKSYAPTFLVEREGSQVDIVILDHLEDTTQQKMTQFFTIARDLAKERHWTVKEVRAIFFIVEMWTSTCVRGEEPKYARPADDPERKEMLVISKLAVVPQEHGKPKLETTMQAVEMLRAGDGELVDLLPIQDEITECRNPLLQAFLAGIASAKLSELQLVKMAKQR